MGRKIVVYDGAKVELGEGTFRGLDYMPELRMTIYECDEHDILVKGDHWLKLEGTLHFVPDLTPAMR